jgi:hypothetical protein
MMNADQKIKYEGLIGAGGATGKTPAQVALLRSYHHNWQNYLLRKGFIQNNTFYYSVCNEQVTDYKSLACTEDTRIIDNRKVFNRITASYNTDYKAIESVKFGFNVFGSYEKFNDSRDRNNV